jgi:hypothetical protein
MEKQREIEAVERESRGWPFTIPALFIRMVGGPIWCGEWLVMVLVLMVSALLKCFRDGKVVERYR